MSDEDRLKEAIKRANGGTTHVSGHSLKGGGAPYRADGTQITYEWIGNGLCDCGALSGLLDTNRERKRWHLQHKLTIVGGSVD